MPVEPGHKPIEPDTPEPRDPIHHPHKQDHPGQDKPDDDLPDADEDEDTGAEPWWMQPASAWGVPRPLPR